MYIDGFEGLKESVREFSNSMESFMKNFYESTEEAYQKKHRKVKDRYASSKFYMNNFKRNKRKGKK